MKRNTKTSVIVAVAVIFLSLFSATVLFAEEEITGRVVVDQGSMGTLNGTLIADGDEWELKTADGLYEIHLGQYGHDTSRVSGLTAGVSAKAEGFIYENHIAPTVLESGGLTYRFREEDGRPMWAGERLGPVAKDRLDTDNRSNGEGRNRQDPPGWGRNRVESKG